MDSKTPLQFEDLPAPAAQGREPTRRPKCNKKRRVFRALGFSAFLFWVGARYHRAGSSLDLYGEDEPAWPILTNVDVDHCADWSDNGEADPDVAIADGFPYSASANFDLPVSGEALFLLARNLHHGHHGHHGHNIFSTGHVKYLQSAEAGDSITVDITAFYWHPDHLDAAKVCFVTRDEQTGVGFFTNWKGHRRHRRHREHQKLRFEVTVTFPSTEDGSALAIKQFLTDLPIFSQTFEDVSNVNFGTLDLKSAVASIRAETLSASNAKIHTSLGSIQIGSLVAYNASLSTSMGSIEGTYNASNSLTLETANGRINVDVTISNDVEDDNKAPAELRMRTSNGAISSNVTLLSPSPSGGAFNISAHTTHAPLALAVLSAPLDAHIALRASTALGSASVSLPPTYEGAFAAHTSLAAVNVLLKDEEVEDPAGKGRERKLEWEGVGRGGKKGRVGWSEEGMKRGEVRVSTSLAPVTLEF
ncbi:hypothetical protein DFH06DRAFT_1081622 [Mycena polygramma]|nr:hypothetical protein DFH06DRAFT_1081622 [Mycena polygramma]